MPRKKSSESSPPAVPQLLPTSVRDAAMSPPVCGPGPSLEPSIIPAWRLCLDRKWPERLQDRVKPPAAAEPVPTGPGLTREKTAAVESLKAQSAPHVADWTPPTPMLLASLNGPLVTPATTGTIAFHGH